MKSDCDANNNFFLHILTFIWRKHWHYILFNIAVSKSRKALQPSYKPSNTTVQVVDFAWSFSLKSLIQTSCFGFQHMRQTHNIYQIKKPVNHIMHLAIFQYLRFWNFLEDSFVSEKRNVQRRVDYRLFSNESKICIKNDQNLRFFDRMMTNF